MGNRIINILVQTSDKDVSYNDLVDIVSNWTETICEKFNVEPLLFAESNKPVYTFQLLVDDTCVDLKSACRSAFSILHGFIPNANVVVKAPKPKKMWTKLDNEIVCEKFIEEYVINKLNTPVNRVARSINGLSQSFSNSSVGFKLRNTKHLAETRNPRIYNTMPGKSYSHASKVHKIAFDSVCRKHHL